MRLEPRSQRADRLGSELEATLLGGARDLRDPFHLAMPLFAVAALVDLDAVAALVLGRIAGDVGGAEQRRDALGIRRDLDDADARADRHRVAGPDEAVIADRLAHRLGDRAGLFQRAAFQQHAELVAAEPRDHVDGAHARLDQRGDLADQPVAGRVAAGVVDQLELVQVDVEQGVARAAADASPCSAACSRASNSRRLISPVSASCAAWKASARRSRRSRVTSWNTTTAPDDAAAAVADRRRRILDRLLLSLAVEQCAVVGRPDAGAAAQRAQQRVLERLARGVVDEAQHLADRPALHLGQRPAGQLLGHRIHVVDAARRRRP